MIMLVLGPNGWERKFDEMPGEVALMSCGVLLVRGGSGCGGERCGVALCVWGMCVQPGGRGVAGARWLLIRDAPVDTTSSVVRFHRHRFLQLFVFHLYSRGDASRLGRDALAWVKRQPSICVVTPSPCLYPFRLRHVRPVRPPP